MKHLNIAMILAVLLFTCAGFSLAQQAPVRLSGAVTDSGGVTAESLAVGIPGEQSFTRPVIAPLPAATAGVANPVISLDGAWKFTLKPPTNFWDNGVDPAGWSEITVPGEAIMQGFDVDGFDMEYPYKRKITIPADYSGKRIFLLFDGVYTYARVWVNGTFVRDHHGGFTSWNCEITEQVKPGETAWVTVGVSDSLLDEYIENMSNYARHSLLGIVRGVRLFAVPQDHISRFHVETDFDAGYSNATLKVTCAMAFKSGNGVELRLRLKDPKGAAVALDPAGVLLTPEKPEAVVNTPVVAPLKWDAEHPNLYTLEAEAAVDGVVVQTLRKKIGFRKVELQGQELRVNGRRVKLRGVAMHDVHPLAGRAVSRAMTESAIRLFKQANMNYLRMSHYPRSDEFYELCDEIGMYVEDDAALVHDAYDAPKTPDIIALNTWAEQVETHRSHPSIILWEIGNESDVGTKIPKMFDYVRREDPSRPCVWPSYNTPANESIIRDQHYPSAGVNLGDGDCAVVYNEYAHMANYNISTLKRDPNARNHWGQGIKMFWEEMVPGRGCLGGAIWSAIDDVFLYSHQPLKELTARQEQGGEWGIIDGWRRAKPEYWLAKKAFSPVRIHDGPVASPAAGSPLQIPVTNWFDHADLSEITLRWAAGRDSGSLRCPGVPPGGAGTLVIPVRAWQAGETLNLKFDWAGMTIDEYNLLIGGELRKRFPPPAGPAPAITEDAESITVTGGKFAVVFSKATGKIMRAGYGKTPMIQGGPQLNLAPVILSGWTLESLTHASSATQALITITGRYEQVAVQDWEDGVVKGQDKDGKEIYHEKPAGPVGVVFVVKIDGQGLINTEFNISNPPPPNAGSIGNTGYDEVGVTYLLPAAVDRIRWERKGLWSAYPEDHIGRNRGTAPRAGKVPVYREEPTWPWGLDEKTFYYFGAEDKGGRGCNDFRSTKENVWNYSACLANSEKQVRVESEAAAVAARAEVVDGERVALHINSVVGYPSLQWGNYCPIVEIKPGYRGSVGLRLTESGK